MELKKVNRYIKTLENNNIILVFHNDILAAIIYKGRRYITTTAENMEKQSIKEYINNYVKMFTYYHTINAGTECGLEIAFNNIGIKA